MNAGKANSGQSLRSGLWAAGIIAVVLSAVACTRARSSRAADATPPAAPAEVAVPLPTFDAAHAFGLLQAQCNFGPRPNGSAAHTSCRDFLIQQMSPLVDEFATQNWTQEVNDPPGQGSYAMTNLLGIIYGRGCNAAHPGPQLMLCAHWDTRPVADQDPDPANRSKPILGADDGASGVAVLLEMARVLKQQRPAQTVIIALWDGEDLGAFFYGARYFAEQSKTEQWRKWKPAQAILIDMIGNRNVRCNREVNSVHFAPDLYQKVLDAAAALDLGSHFEGPQMDVEDDHLPLNAAGIPSIDLIDFSYKPWHTLQDTPDKCSPDSLKVIGDVLLRVTYTATLV